MRRGNAPSRATRQVSFLRLVRDGDVAPHWTMANVRPHASRRFVVVETGTGMGESYLDRYRGVVKGYVERDDAAILADLRAAFAAHPELDSRGIEARALHGDVTLTGTVASAAMRSLAVDIARGVRGVAIVHDDILLRPPHS